MAASAQAVFVTTTETMIAGMGGAPTTGVSCVQGVKAAASSTLVSGALLIVSSFVALVVTVV